jgi:hypothetical protein
LPENDILFTFAELAVALAGFSAIIGVLGTRPSASDIRVDGLRLQVMLEASLAVAAFSIIPGLLDHFDIATGSVWRISAGIFLLIQVPTEFLGILRTREMPDMTLTRLNVNTINWALSIAADLIALGVALNWMGDRANAYYMLAVFLLLGMSGLLFIQFAASTFVPGDE